MVRKAAVVAGIIVLLVAVLVRSRPPQAASDVQPPLVQAVPVRVADVQAVSTVSGQVEPLHSAIVASEVSGQVLRRPHPGDSVQVGQVLVVVDADVAQAQVDQAVAAATRAWAACRQAQEDYQRACIDTDATLRQARAQLVSAEASALKLRHGARPQELESAEAARDQAIADETVAEKDATRYRELLNEDAIPRQLWDQAQDRLETARARRRQAEASLSLAREGARGEDRLSSQAQVQSAQAGVEEAGTRDLRLATMLETVNAARAQAQEADAAVRQARIELARHQVRAPFSGRILATPVEVGERVTPGLPLFRIGEVHRVKATFTVAEQNRRALALHAPVAITCDAVPQRTFAGRVTMLSYQADVRTRAFPIEVTVDNPDQAMLPGMVVRLPIAGATEKELLVPLTAVETDGATSYVYVLAGTTAERRPVRLGDPHGADVAVLDGVREGERVAATPQRLTPGSPVRVTTP